MGGSLDRYCSLQPFWSGMGEVVPARTSPTLHPPSPPTAVIIMVKSPSASIVVTSTFKSKFLACTECSLYEEIIHISDREGQASPNHSSFFPDLPFMRDYKHMKLSEEGKEK